MFTGSTIIILDSFIRFYFVSFFYDILNIVLRDFFLWARQIPGVCCSILFNSILGFAVLSLLGVSLTVSFLILFFKRVSAYTSAILRLYFRLGHKHLSISLLSKRVMVKAALVGKGERKP